MDSIKMARLDFLAIKSNIASSIVMTLFLTILFSFVFGTYLLVGFSCAWAITLIGMLSFHLQESNSLELFYGSVPLTAKDVVMGRYLSTFILFVISLIMGVVVFTAISAIKASEPQVADIISGISIALLVYTILAGVTTPALFKLGYTKGRIISTTLFFVIMGIFILASFAFTPTIIFDLASRFSSFLVPICVIASAAILTISYRISVIAYRKRK